MSRGLRFLLLQVRNVSDPMRTQEVRCFTRALNCAREQIEVRDLLAGAPSRRQLASADVVLLGGSGEYSVAEGGPWLPAALDAMRGLYELSKPTFASCWGFQAMSQALGGAVTTDASRAELGSVEVRLTPRGQENPLFAPLGKLFLAQMGHQDIVVRLPEHAVLLASSERVENQAYTFPDRPIYCTQFHPELDRDSLLQRVEAYPQYVERIAGIPVTEFARTHCRETPETDSLLRRFVELVAQ